MVDAVTTNVIANPSLADIYVVQLNCISDGTGETTVIKVVKANLLNANGGTVAALDIEWVAWSIQGFASVRLLWDHSTDDLALPLAAGTGYNDFRGSFNDEPIFTANDCLKDPRSAGGLGDILLTSNGAVNGATYCITLGLRKRAS